MKKLSAKVNKPRDQVSKSVDDLNRQIKQSIAELSHDLKSDKIDFIKYTEELSGVFDKTVSKLSEINSVDTSEIADRISTLKSDIQQVKTAIESVELDPKTEVNVEPPDLSKIEESIKTIPRSIQALLQGVDFMEREELDKNFKEIIKLLEKIAAVEWVSQGTTIVGGGNGDALTDEQLRASPVEITGTISAEAAPTFKLDPSDAEETPKYGKVDADGHAQVDVLSSDLPTGAATEDKQLPDNHQVTVSNPTADPETGLAKETKQDKMFDGDRLDELSFAETINTGSFFETDWFDARSIPWLTFKGEIPATSAFTATLTSSTAADPNNGNSEDFETIAEATIAGTALGAPNNTPIFSLAGHSWIKIKLTNLTGANHDVKVVTRGSGQPGTPSIIPIGASVTRDYGAAINRSVTMGIDDTTGEPENVQIDANKNLYTRSVPRPASEAPGLERFEAVAVHTGTNATLQAAPGAGKRIVITDYAITAFNDSTGTTGQIHLRETNTSGDIKIPHSLPTAASLSASSPLSLSQTFNEPIKLGDNEALFLHFAAANTTASVVVTGYIEDV